MSTRKTMYALITPKRVRFFSTHSRAIKVYRRAEKMGLTIEFVSDRVRTGDPYKRAVINKSLDWD